MDKLTFAYWIKNESPYLLEYLEFHLLQGVDHFIFYDNKSTDNTKEVLAPYIEAGLVELREYPPHITQRNNFYMMEHLLKEQVGKTEWLHFGAVDERIFAPDFRKLPEVLKDYHQFGGLAVAWEEFNSSGHEKKTSGLITDRFTTTCKDTAQHIKTIVRPECVTTHQGNPHCFYFKPGYMAVDENKQVVTGPWNTSNPYTYKIIKNHHYRTLSREEYEVKANKGLLDHPGQENIRRPDADEGWDWCHNRAEKGYNDDLKVWSEPIKVNIENRLNYSDVFFQARIWYDI